MGLCRQGLFLSFCWLHVKDGGHPTDFCDGRKTKKENVKYIQRRFFLLYFFFIVEHSDLSRRSYSEKNALFKELSLNIKDFQNDLFRH
jgi:hypothetical protein